MKTLITSAVAAIALTTSAFADGHTSSFMDMTFDDAVNVNASDLIGSFVYATEDSIENNMIAEGGETEWDNIGDINEIVLTRDGNVASVIVGVGGFLGMGEKDVAISMDQLQFVSDGEDADEYFVVVNASAVGVQDAPSYTVAMTSDADMDEPEMDTNADMDMDRMPLSRPMVERDGFANVEMEDLNTEDLTGARVYGASDEDIGEVSELLLSDGGEIERAVLDIGGFIGLGEHSIAVPMDELQIVRSDDGDEFRVYIESSQEALEAQPEYEG